MSTTTTTTNPIPPPPPPPPPTDTPSSSTPTTSTTSTGPTITLLPPPIPTTASSTSTSISTSSNVLSTGTTVSTSTTSTTAPVTTAPPTSSSIIVTTPAGGSVITLTSVITATSRNVAPTGAVNASTNKGFFKNTGAVAGVFTVVGLIVLAILIALVTNSIRRRRAKKFDDEIAAAARDAANAQVPNFYDEDDDFRPGFGAAKYSDVSHGTFSQPPLNPANPQETYNMREIAHGPAPGEYFDSGNYSTATGSAGAAGIGVARARSMRDGGYAAGLQDGSSPYAAFAIPTAAAGAQYPPGMIRGAGAPEFDLNRRPSQYTQQTDYTALSRNKSVTSAEGSSSGAYGSSTAAPSTTGPYNGQQDTLYNPHAQQGGYPNSFGAYATAAPAPTSNANAPIPSRSEEDLDAAYGGYVVDEPTHAAAPAGLSSSASPQEHLPNPFSAGPDSRPDIYADGSDDEQEPPRRVLKVANE